MTERGKNDLLDACYRDQARAEFRAEVLFALGCLAVVAFVWWKL